MISYPNALKASRDLPEPPVMILKKSSTLSLASIAVLIRLWNAELIPPMVVSRSRSCPAVDSSFRTERRAILFAASAMLYLSAGRSGLAESNLFCSSRARC